MSKANVFKRQQSLNAIMGGGVETGTSIFDPVLCEIAYRWFSPPGGYVLDPFAGGSVRGIVASELKRHYIGIDLSDRQIRANRAQAKAICSGHLPKWHIGDAANVAKIVKRNVDFIFTCPPYADLEVYSDDPADLSTMAFDKFAAAYRAIISDCCAKLAADRFACFVVGDARDKRGFITGCRG